MKEKDQRRSRPRRYRYQYHNPSTLTHWPCPKPGDGSVYIEYSQQERPRCGEDIAREAAAPRDDVGQGRGRCARPLSGTTHDG